MTPARRQKAKVSRQLKAHKKNDNIKRKEAEEFSKLEVDFERLKNKHKSISEEHSSLKRHMVSLEQPVRGSAAYEKNDQIRPAALLVKEFADAAQSSSWKG